eukprot:Sdes_comp22282_c0_seq1m20770
MNSIVGASDVVKIPVELKAQIGCIDVMLNTLNNLRTDLFTLLSEMMENSSPDELLERFRRGSSNIEKRTLSLTELAENLQIKLLENLQLVNVMGFELPDSYLSLDCCSEIVYESLYSSIKWEQKFKRHFFAANQIYSKALSTHFPEETVRFAKQPFFAPCDEKISLVETNFCQYER